MTDQLLRPEDQRQLPVVVKIGTTSAAGAADGSTVVDLQMASAAGTSGLYMVINPDNPLTAVVRQISGAPDAAGVMTLSSAFAAQVASGTRYAIVNAGVGAGGAGVNLVAVADAAANATMNDVIGNKSDAAVYTVGVVASIMAHVKGLMNRTAPVKVTATFSYLDAGGEQTVFTIAPPAGQTWDVTFFALDINTLTQNNTVRTKKRIDGATFHTIASVLALSTDEAVFDGGHFMVDNTSQLQVTMQEVVDEAAARAIPYEYYYKRLI